MATLRQEHQVTLVINSTHLSILLPLVISEKKFEMCCGILQEQQKGLFPAVVVISTVFLREAFLFVVSQSVVLWYFGNPHIPNFFGSITPSISHTAQEAHTTIIIERSVLTSPGVSLKQKSLCILSKSFFVDLIYNRNECLHQGCCYPRKPQIIWTMKTLTLTNNILINLTIFTFNAPRYL